MGCSHGRGRDGRPCGQWLGAKANASAASSSAGVVQFSPACWSLNLNGTWQLTYGPIKDLAVLKQNPSQPPADFTTIPATVPGNVELDLMAAGRLPDLYHGANVYEALKLEANQWWYRRTFTAPRLVAGEKAELVFDGLDCVGTVWLNGKLAGRSANMFIPHRFDVTGLLRPRRRQRTAGANRSGRARRSTGAPHPGRVRLGWALGADDGPPQGGAPVRLRHGPADHQRRPVRATCAWKSPGPRIGNRSIGPPRRWIATKKTAKLVLDWEFATNRAEIRDLQLRVTLSRNGKIALRRADAGA